MVWYYVYTRYAGMLKSHKPNLVPEQDFHKKIASDNETKLPPQVSICLLLVFIDFVCIWI